MPARMIQNNFSGGEISPVLYGRSDLQSYYKGCALAENFVVSKEGTLRKRRGIRAFTKLEVTSSDGNLSTPDYSACRIVPYRYDRTRGGFLLVWKADGADAFSVSYFDKDGAPRGEAASFDGAGSVKDLQWKQIGDQIWLSNGSSFKIVTVTSGDDGAVTGIAVSDWARTPKPEQPTLSATGYNENGNVYDGSGETSIGYCAIIVSGGVMSNMAKSSAYQKKSWVAGAYVSISVSVTRQQLNSGFDYVAVGKSVGGTYGELTRFYPEDFGKGVVVWYSDKNVSPGDGIYLQTDVLGKNFSNPLCVDCFQQRRVFANASTEGRRYPMTLWFSEVGNLSNFMASRPTVDSDAFSPTISSTGPAFIRWICTFQDSVVLFTDCGLFSVGFTQTSGFSAQSCRISKFSDLAVCETIQPVATDAGIVFVGADRKTVYTVSYSLEDNAMKPVNRTVLVEHLTRTNRIVAMALQNYPDSVVWFVLEDGTLATFTYERNEEVYAWSRGRVDGARVLDVVSLGTVTDGVGDRTYTDLVFVVESASGEASAQYLARMDASYADTVGGVASPVVATLRTLRPESQERTLAGVKKNVKDVLLRLYETGSVKVVSTRGDGVVPLVKAKTGTDGLFSGDVKVMPSGFVNEEGQMTFVSDDDRPCEILMTLSTVEV